MSESRISFVRLFVGFFLSATGSCCPIELSPPSVVVRYGDPVSVNCSTSETIHEGMGWEASRGGTTIEMVNHLPWTVEKLTEWSISPSCFINSVSGQCLKNLEVVVYTFPEIIDISSNDVMTEGQPYIFTCDIGDVAPIQNLTVRWYKGDTIFQTQTFDYPSKKPVDLSPVLSITPTRQDEGVKFRCEAHLDLGPEGPQLNVFSKEFNTTVRFGPDVQCSAVEVFEGETLWNRCPVTGNPPPLVIWWKDEKPVDLNQIMTREKAGVYTIRAEGFSVIEKAIQVIVKYGPELNCPSKYIAQEYTRHDLTCTAEGYPEPKTVWYRDGNEVELPENLTRSDAGWYLITASNDFSSVNHTVELVIIYPPSKIVIELEHSEVEVGSAVSLQCSSMSNPRPTYTWSYYRADNVIEENDDGVSRLLINSATAYNMGFYTCQASNEGGSVSTTVRVTVKGVKRECPIEITPDSMVIPYKSKAKDVNCTTSTISTNVKKIWWKGVEANGTIWRVDTHNGWDLSPVCSATFEGIETCQKPLNFILYKIPDSISIRPVNNSISVEDEKFQLQCDIINVAPVRNLTVRWYHGNETIEPPIEDSLQVTGCPRENSRRCDIRTPVNVSSTISINLKRKHNKAEFRCEVQLDLGPERPQLPDMKSSPLNITVYYKPVINDTKLPKTIPVFRGYPEELVCEADGHPPPKIQWLDSLDKLPRVPGGTLIVSEPGVYRCNATNEIGSISREVEVILKEDYLPLIAGFVAVTVVVISIIFIFIYSIYYKNTKMRRYSLKNPKLSTHNGNVAHNGWDLQFPMTKLS